MKKFLGVVECQGRIYVFGSGGTVECYNPQTNTWCMMSNTCYAYDNQAVHFPRPISEFRDMINQAAGTISVGNGGSGGSGACHVVSSDISSDAVMRAKLNIPDPEGESTLRDVRDNKNIVKVVEVKPVETPVEFKIERL